MYNPQNFRKQMYIIRIMFKNYTINENTPDWSSDNPWIRFESDDSFIKFEIGTNWFNLVQFYSTFLLHILHFLTLSIFSGQNLCNLRLHLQFSTFDSKLQLHFNFKIQLQTEISDSNFNPQFQTSTATSNIDLKHQL